MYIIGNLYNKSPNIIFQTYPINEPSICNKNSSYASTFKSLPLLVKYGKAKIFHIHAIPSLYSKSSFIYKVMKMLYNVISISQQFD